MNNVRWPILVGGGVITLLLVAILASGFGKDPKIIVPTLAENPAPGFSLVDLDGKTWTLEELKGKPVYINFWSTWCGPCKVEHPMLLQLARMYPDVQFLGVIYQDKPKAIEVQMKRMPYSELMAGLESAGIAYPNLIDPGGRKAIEYGITGVPESIFVDRTGLVTHKENGPLSPQLAREQLDRIRQ